MQSFYKRDIVTNIDSNEHVEIALWRFDSNVKIKLT